MELTISEINPDVDFPAIARCLFESHEHPPQEFFHLWFPIHGDDEQAREAAINEAATRLKHWHTGDPTGHWLKVVDTSTGKLAGASLWNIYQDSNPFAEPDSMEVTWFPDKGSRTLVEQMLVKYGAPREKAAQKPHICQSRRRNRGLSGCW